MADNVWIQAMPIILPRVRQHYSVLDSYIGSLSSAMFSRPTGSDILGRSAAFNATLFTAVCGFFASFANSFGMFCFALFLLVSAVGIRVSPTITLSSTVLTQMLMYIHFWGAMRTDGTLLLEHMLKEKQCLVTTLSIFFSFDSVLSAFVALLVLPRNSCSNSSTGLAGGLGLVAACDVETRNRGWKSLLVTLATIVRT
ncbi:hypothetical protein P691DRAFT_590960 [Macrolepiota fuliginosa MF-IS2]|uniref:Uncharacterized protein n=1 Tax=Macrolepiota fuliginosa MF-IS2 TaxID=1400762 RepID=A0A9P5X0K3_9AGAR|nr:hypothetical protein P691DRAFT_590960 [Macrolepiota fuliginosa MF-IS2]